jgi:hypothetical protein
MIALKNSSLFRKGEKMEDGNRMSHVTQKENQNGGNETKTRKKRKRREEKRREEKHQIQRILNVFLSRPFSRYVSRNQPGDLSQELQNCQFRSKDRRTR